MSKQKYYYAVVKKDNGNLLLEGHKLPFYWLKKIAKETADKFEGYIVTRINLCDIEKLILSSTPLFQN